MIAGGRAVIARNQIPARLTPLSERIPDGASAGPRVEVTSRQSRSPAIFAVAASLVQFCISYSALGFGAPACNYGSPCGDHLRQPTTASLTFFFAYCVVPP